MCERAGTRLLLSRCSLPLALVAQRRGSGMSSFLPHHRRTARDRSRDRHDPEAGMIAVAGKFATLFLITIADETLG